MITKLKNPSGLIVEVPTEAAPGLLAADFRKVNEDGTLDHADQGELETTKIQVAALEAAFDKVSAERHAAVQSAQDAATQLATVTATVTTLEAESKTKDQAILDLKAEIELGAEEVALAKNKAASLETQLAEAKSKVSVLETEKAQLADYKARTASAKPVTFEQLTALNGVSDKAAKTVLEFLATA